MSKVDVDQKFARLPSLEVPALEEQRSSNQGERGRAGNYAWQAAIVACHARASTAADPGSILAGYHLLPCVRGDLLMKLGKLTKAREEIQRAIAVTENRTEQDLLAGKLKQISSQDANRDNLRSSL